MGKVAKLPDTVAAVPVEPEYVPRTPLGRKLMRLRKRIEKSGVPLLDWDDLEREIAERRGARNP
jgi:hypothetical protein